jgi:hypothetical protein
MRLLTELFALPAGLLLLIATSPVRVPAQALQWPYNLPPHVKYYPEDEALVRRNLEIQRRLQQQPAAGVKKMSDDPGEMFFLDYWSFASQADGNTTTSSIRAAGQTYQLRTQHSNDSLSISFEQPFPLHSNREIAGSSIFPRHLRSPLFEQSLNKRGFQCPSGTAACTALNPNVCCAVSETCVTVQDTGTGLGTVGCCPNGETCAGTLSVCPSGYTSCPSNPGGGCCIPGYTCFGVGCVLSSTATVYVAPTVKATSTSTPQSTTTIVVVPSVTHTPSSIATTLTPSGASTSTTTTTRTASSTSTVTRATCAYGFQSCASSLGGGCCSNSMVCGSQTCLPQSSTMSVVAPYRPTSVRDTTTTTTHSSISGAGCPTGYYACSAYYPGRCCQIGRDCSQTSCPTSASTTLVSSNSLTIIAPSGSGISRNSAAVTGTCASGWFSCAATVGGGCCPGGYGCGTSCTATASGGQGNVVPKVAPSSATKMYAWQDIWFACTGTLAAIFFAAFR